MEKILHVMCPLCGCEKEMTRGEMRAMAPRGVLLYFSKIGIPRPGLFGKLRREQARIPMKQGFWSFTATREAFRCEQCGAIVT